MADLRVLQSDWLRASWRITQEPEFSQVWDLCMQLSFNTRIRKSNDKSFGKTLKTLIFGHFGFILPTQFFWEKYFLEKLDSVTF